MKLKIKKLNPDAKIPAYARENDAGFDIFSIEQYTLKPNERKSFSTGIAFELEPGFVALVWDKSGLSFKHGIKTMGGVIDSNYRGEIFIALLNTSKTDYEIEKGDKIANILIQPVICANIEEIDDLPANTSRGDKGFGSSGRK
ncbi:MAG: dUTP diphosphatase [Candidatus Woesearchaeota archaeon]|jgi:dUTP pyrophosphatase